jgi:hypothetical protein
MSTTALHALLYVFKAHSALRYLLLAAALGAILYYGFSLATRRSPQSRDRALAASFNGLVDLQLTLGIALILLGRVYPALIGHIVMMIAAAAAAHLGVIVYRRRRQATLLPLLIGLGSSLLLMVGGILALGRGVLVTTAF